MNKSELLARIRNLQREVDGLMDIVIMMEDSEPHHAQDVHPIDDDWMTVSQVCEALHISDSTFYDWLKAGLLPEGVVFGPRSKRWKMADIKAWQERRQDNIVPVKVIVAEPVKRRRGRMSKIHRKEEFYSV